MANLTEASAAVAPSSGPQVPPPPPPGPLPEHPVVGTSESGAGVEGRSNLGAGVHGVCQRALGVANSGAAAGVLGEAWNGPGVSGFSFGGDGVFGECNARNGVHGLTAGTGAGVWGENTGSGGPAVRGTSVRGVGVLGEASSAAGVSGNSNSGSGVEGFSTSGPGVRGVSGSGNNGGVSGDNTGSGYGVAGTSAQGPAVIGKSTQGTGVIGLAAGTSEPGHGPTGVIGCTSSGSDAGVWGDNTGSGYGVAGTSAQGPAVIGKSTQGSGVIGLAAGTSEPGHGPTGILGCTSSGSDAGVWGDNTGSGYGVVGTSAQGQGVVGLAAKSENPPPGLNGVFGRTTNGNHSGVWGDNSGSADFANGVRAVGVAGTNTNGTGVFGSGIIGVHGTDGRVPSQVDPGAGLFEGKVTVHGDHTCHGQATFNSHVTVNTGTLTMNGGDIRLPGADCAEQFDVAGARQLDPGTVVVIDENGALRESSAAYDRKVAGVVSGAGEYRPGIVLGGASHREDRALVAVVGKVYCRVDARHGPIELGDLLTTSPTPGHAMRAGDPTRAFGAVIGKALRPMSDGCGLLPMLVALQ